LTFQACSDFTLRTSPSRTFYFPVTPPRSTHLPHLSSVSPQHIPTSGTRPVPSNHTFFYVDIQKSHHTLVGRHSRLPSATTNSSHSSSFPDQTAFCHQHVPQRPPEGIAGFLISQSLTVARCHPPCFSPIFNPPLPAMFPHSLSERLSPPLSHGLLFFDSTFFCMRVLCVPIPQPFSSVLFLNAPVLCNSLTTSYYPPPFVFLSKSPQGFVFSGVFFVQPRLIFHCLR